VSETCYELTSQTLALRIEQQLLSTGTGALDLLVFDPEPFLIARVTVPDYQQSDSGHYAGQTDQFSLHSPGGLQSEGFANAAAVCRGSVELAAAARLSGATLARRDPR
jgi:hypothetical protein